MQEEFVVEMKAAEAINHVGEYFGLSSLYEMSKQLSDDTLTIQVIQLSKYRRGLSKMSKKVADRFEEVYGIKIIDIAKRGVFAK